MKQESIDGNKKTGKILFEAGILIMIINLLSVYGIWQSISNDWKILNGGELCFQAFIQSGGKYVITYLNQESIYISFLSVLFSFLGNKEETVSIINLILQLAGIVFFYCGAKKLFRFVYPLAIAVISGVLSVCFYPVITDTSMHIIWFLSGTIFWLGSITVSSNTSGKVIKQFLLGILLGIFSYIDMAGVFLSVAFVLLILLTEKCYVKVTRILLLNFCYFLLGIANGYFVMFYLWNNFTLNTAVFNQWYYNKLLFFTKEAGQNQYVSLGLILVIVLILYILRRSRKVMVTDIPVAEESVDILTPIQDVTKETEESLHVKTETTEVEEITPNTTTEVPTPIKLLDNPLPLPKKHVKKEMNYAFQPSPEQMHYDLNNYRLDDDYDLKEN